MQLGGLARPLMGVVGFKPLLIILRLLPSKNPSDSFPPRRLRGRIREINLTEGENFLVAFGKSNQVTVDRIINCTGSESNYAKIDQPLVKNLIGRGDIKPDALFIGLETAPTGEIINKRGEVSKTFYTFATAQKGVLWECTAMPDIRNQAQKLAARLLENIKSKI